MEDGSTEINPSLLIDGTVREDVFDIDYFDNPGGVIEGYNSDQQRYIAGDGTASYLWEDMADRFLAKVSEYIILRSGMTLLDVGCARGYFGLAVERVAREKYGVELSAYGIDYSRYIIETADPDARVRQCGAHEIDAKRLCSFGWPTRYTIVCSLGVLQYIGIDDLPDTLERIRSIAESIVFIENSTLPTDDLRPEDVPDAFVNMRTPDAWVSLAKTHLMLYMRHMFVSTDGVVYIGDKPRMVTSIVVYPKIPDLRKIVGRRRSDRRCVNVEIRYDRFKDLSLYSPHVLYNRDTLNALEQGGFHEIVEVSEDGEVLLTLPHIRHELIASQINVISLNPVISSTALHCWFSSSPQALLRAMEILDGRRSEIPDIGEFSETVEQNSPTLTHFHVVTHLFPTLELARLFGTSPYLFKQYDIPVILPHSSYESFVSRMDAKTRAKWKRAETGFHREGFHYGPALDSSTSSRSLVLRFFDRWFEVKCLESEPFLPVPDVWHEHNRRLFLASLDWDDRNYDYKGQRDLLILPIQDKYGEVFGIDIWARLLGDIWERCWFCYDETKFHRDLFPGWFFNLRTSLEMSRYDVKYLSQGPEDALNSARSEADIELHYKYRLSEARWSCFGVNSDSSWGTPDKEELRIPETPTIVSGVSRESI